MNLKTKLISYLSVDSKCGVQLMFKWQVGFKWIFRFKSNDNVGQISNYFFVYVIVQKAWGLLTKGNNNSNDCFVTIVLGKVKYQTSVKLKAGPSVEWHEECEL